MCQLHVGAESFALTGAVDTVEVKTGIAPHADALLRIDTRVFMRLASARIEPTLALEGVEIQGDRLVASDVLAMLSGSVR